MRTLTYRFPSAYSAKRALFDIHSRDYPTTFQPQDLWWTIQQKTKESKRAKFCFFFHIFRYGWYIVGQQQTNRDTSDAKKFPDFFFGPFFFQMKKKR